MPFIPNRITKIFHASGLTLIPIPPVNGKFFPKYRHFFNMSRINLVNLVGQEGLFSRVSRMKQNNPIVSSNLCEIFEVGKIGANLPNWI
jgi:hypothetical protein